MSQLSDWWRDTKERNISGIKEIHKFRANPFGRTGGNLPFYARGGKSALIQKLEAGAWGKTFGLDPHGEGIGPFASDFHKDWAGDAWQDRTGFRGSDLDKPHGRNFADSYSGSNLMEGRLGIGTDPWKKFNEQYGAGAWEDRLGSNISGKTEDGGTSTVNTTQTVSDDDEDDDEATIEKALTETGDESPPSAMDSRAYGWASNIRRSLGNVGEDLYKTRGEKASILTRRGLLG